ncbi:twin-arginine translocase subunit TatC [Sulfitobacter aestuariivivens]|uniref:Sec-independent protein translocase protein TatC n=1 Tax=Sulfitobacter aestuariivivens TaxID=2766981 RepID=A0A927D351_9RHOB|nr:twin-arginine translocase subunit TatC [Sulfitobacter aestuariivivens]MBD3663531.1 twin-arginine translocase subunit TatC [Sulfitobacter aestuariivivens]
MSTSDDTDEIEASSAPLIEHLAELRTRLIRSVLALLVAITFFFIPIQGDFIAEHVMNFLLNPVVQTLRDLGDENPALQFTAPQEYLFTLFRVSMVGGFALAFPVIGFQMWRFVAPGLYRQEKNAFLPFLIASPAMFFLGASFAQLVVTPLAMTFLLGFADASSFLTNIVSTATNGAVEAVEKSNAATITFNGKVNESLDITLKFIMAFGLCFQLPVLLTLMGKAGLVSAEGLGNVRKYAMVGILVLAALVTPPDVITQLILFVVVYGLYEISIQLVKRVETKREAQLRADGYYDDEDEDPTIAEMGDEDEDRK